MLKVMREINTSMFKRIYIGVLQVRIAANKNTNSISFKCMSPSPFRCTVYLCSFLPP